MVRWCVGEEGEGEGEGEGELNVRMHVLLFLWHCCGKNETNFDIFCRKKKKHTKKRGGGNAKNKQKKNKQKQQKIYKKTTKKKNKQTKKKHLRRSFVTHLFRKILSCFLFLFFLRFILFHIGCVLGILEKEREKPGPVA